MLHAVDTRPHASTAVRITGKADRRAVARLDCNRLAYCRSRNGLQWRCRAIDLSPLGVCVVFWSVKEPPDVAILGFHDHQGDYIVLGARMAYIRRRGNFWLVGCAFERPLNEKELAGLT